MQLKSLKEFCFCNYRVNILAIRVYFDTLVVYECHLGGTMER
jgi:hypothetical protein